MKKFVIPAIILITIFAAAYIILNWQKDSYSMDVLKLEILGPTEVSLGQEVEYIVKLKNNGDFRLENPQLVFIPPENSIRDDKVIERQILGAGQLGEMIYPGEEKNFSFKMRIFGREGENKIAKATLSYQPKDLKARYEGQTSFTTLVKSIPFTFEFDLPSKVEVGKEFDFRINYFSSIDFPLTSLRCQVDYPLGFEFVSSNPKSIDKSEWEVPVLNKSEGGRIGIKGKLSGEVGQAKILRARIGLWKGTDFILLKEIEKGVEIVKASLYLRQEINGNPQYTATPGDWLHYQVYFKNIGDEPQNNLFLVNKLEGDLFDFSTIRSDAGNFQPGDNSIIFDWRKVDSLSYLMPTREGVVDFWVKLKDDMLNVQNPVLKNKVFIGQVSQEFDTKIGSKLEIVQKGFYHDEVFGNSGPVPPRAGESTTYTVLWQIKNYYSDIKDAKVKAFLPPNSSLTGNIFPEGSASKFSFDSQSREIVWSLGDLLRSSSTSIVFQVAFIPDSTQRGTAPQIVGEAKISGEDNWTGTILKYSAPPLTTALPDDPTGGGFVQ